MSVATPVSPQVMPEQAHASGFELHAGDRMSREEYQRLYERMPEDCKAELIGGIVYLASPLRIQHGKPRVKLAAVFAAYEGRTPGVEVGDNTTILLGEEAEPQPDLYLRILPEYGGQSRTSENDYVEGPPELIAEIAHSSRALDLHAKKDDYARHGVMEYLVLCLQERVLRWFDLRASQELPIAADGIVRLRTFPGLWIDAEALLSGDYNRLMSALQQGLVSAEHTAFVNKLAAKSGNG